MTTFQTLRVAVREAARDDLPTIVDIYNQAVEDGIATCDLSAFSPEERVDWFDAHHGRYRIWVADVDGEVVGWIALSPYDPKPCFVLTGSIATYVARDARSGGVGSTLRRHLVAQAKRLGFHTLVTRIWATNEASVALSEKFGWDRVAHLREVVSKDGEFIDCFLYQLVL